MFQLHWRTCIFTYWNYKGANALSFMLLSYMFSIISCQIWKFIFHPLYGLPAWLNSKGIDFIPAVSPFTVKDFTYAVAFVDGWYFGISCSYIHNRKVPS